MINLLSDYYEDIPSPKNSFELIFYNLNWKESNIIQFTKKNEKIINKLDKNIKEEIMSSIETITGKSDFLFYIMSIEGIIITRQLIKSINYIESNINKILNLSIVDYEIIKNNSSHFSIYIIKEESKYFYNLEKCEINLTQLNNKILNSQDPNLSNNNINLDDEEQKKSEKRDDELIIETNFSEKLNINIGEYLFIHKYDRPFKKYIFYRDKDNIENEKNILLNKDTLYKIYLRDGIPYEKRPQRKLIKKIVIKNNDFSKRNLDILFHFKECIEMLIVYKNLEKFAFYLNNIPNSNNFKGWKYISKLFYENYNIRWINLKNSFLTDKSLEIIISSLLDKRIRYLNLCNNNLTDEIMKKLELFLEKNSTLKRLYLGYNEITSKGLFYIQEGIKKHPNLNLLQLSACFLRNCGLSLKEINKNLKNLFIKNVSLNLLDFQFLSYGMIKDDCVISYLDIGFNSLEEHEEYYEISNIIKINKSLKKLCLDGMKFNMKNYLPIFTSIYKNKNIECYSFNQNKDLRLEGILNFFSQNKIIKELSIIPWDTKVHKNKKFSNDEIKLFKIFHKNNPKVKIHGIDFKKI